MGHACSRFFTHLPANGFLHLNKSSRNSFVWTILPVTPTRRRICTEFFAIFMKTRNFAREGGGGGTSSTYTNVSLSVASKDVYCCLQFLGTLLSMTI